MAHGHDASTRRGFRGFRISATIALLFIVLLLPQKAKMKKVIVTTPALSKETAMKNPAQYGHMVTGILDRVGRAIENASAAPPPVVNTAAGEKMSTESYTSTGNSTIGSSPYPSSGSTSVIDNATCSFNFTDSLNDTQLPDNVCDMSAICNQSNFYSISVNISNPQNAADVSNSIFNINKTLDSLSPSMNASNSSLWNGLSNEMFYNVMCAEKNSSSIQVVCEVLLKLPMNISVCSVIKPIGGGAKLRGPIRIRRLNENLDDLNDLLNSSNLNASTVDRIVSRMESILAGNVQAKMAGMLVGVVSNFLNVSPVLLAPVSKRLITVVDTIGLKVNFSSESVNFTSPSMALAVTKINASAFSQTSFAIQNSMGLQVDLVPQAPVNSVGSITLPSSLLDNLAVGNKDLASRIQFNFFEKASLFQDLSLQNQSLASYIISAAVSNLTISQLTTDITVTLRTSTPSSQDNFTLKCVFWDLSRNNGSGGWASEGCVLAESRSNETVCKCNHLTSFAVLLDFSRNSSTIPAEQVLILTFITYIGCGLSAIFLAITLVTYIAFEKIRRDYPSQILIQLCAALLCLNLTFLLDSWIALYNHVPGLCFSVAAFLHYFLLVTFTWMGLEAFHMYLALVKVYMQPTEGLPMGCHGINRSVTFSSYPISLLA